MGTKLGQLYIIIRSGFSSIMAVNGLEKLQLFALKFKKIAVFDFVYTLASTIIDQSAPNLVI